MAYLQCEFSSEVLSRTMTMSVILPQGNEKKEYTTLYLLHGFSDNGNIWMRNTSIERYALEKNIAVVMPSVDNSYYTDMKSGGRFFTYLTEEVLYLSRQFFPLSNKREHTFVAGNSMGGFGALKWGLNFPDEFAAIASLSGVTDMVSHLDRIREQPGDKKESLELVFGKDSIAGSENDIINRMKHLDKSIGNKPKFYQACGRNDFLYDVNKRFYHESQQTNLDITHIFNEGDHTWDYWDKQIKHVLDWLPIES
ncbi:alpha/beta hydrolase [Oceanobacillus sp. 1P07AA]|uniref:alpha/beta hydrolase n=1 Tax=Oceanobacillus sp. 1P07AA TaxID=3132293 RepID=UPI0039A684B3